MLGTGAEAAHWQWQEVQMQWYSYSVKQTVSGWGKPRQASLRVSGSLRLNGLHAVTERGAGDLPSGVSSACHLPPAPGFCVFLCEKQSNKEGECKSGQGEREGETEREGV